MPLGQLSVLQYSSLTAMVRAFRYPDLQLSARFGGLVERTKGGDTAEWDILRKANQRGHIKAPGAPSKRVPLHPAGHRATRCLHYGENKMLDGDRMENIRGLGTDTQAVMEEYVGSEQEGLAMRDNRLREVAISQAMTGTLAMTDDDTIVSVDYGVDATHKPTASASWATAGTDIPADIRAWKRLIRRDSGFNPALAFCNEDIMTKMMANTAVKEFLGAAEYKAQVGQTGYIVRFMGLDWIVYDDGYDTDAGVFTPFIAADKVLFTPAPSKEWFRVIEGSTKIPTQNKETLVSVFGKHSYRTVVDDPAGIKLIVGDRFIPALVVPDAIVYADVTP